MQISRLEAHAPQIDTEAVTVGIYADGTLTHAAREVDQASGGLLRRLLDAKEFAGNLCDTLVLHGPPGVSARKVVLAGLGPKHAFDRKAAYRSCAAAAQVLSRKRHAQVAWFLGEDWKAPETAAGIAGMLSGCHGQDLYRTEKKHHPFGQVLWCGGDGPSVEQGTILGESILLTRRLVNGSPDAIHPETFAAEAQAIAQECGLSVEVWDQGKLEAERCGALLGVARGSTRPPRLVILRHRGGPTSAAPLALVGKGVTFESGGLSLKPSDSMITMKCDMAGAATVLGAMQAIARLKLPVNVIGLMGLVENMPSGNALMLGEILTARTGKTIEVHNTDAEGRLVLADVLSVAVELGADRIVDLATLTGACVVALGRHVAGMMSNDESWSETVRQAAAKAGEPVWPLPMFAEYADDIKCESADIKNVGDGRWGGAISAAKFLEEFVSGTPWVHFDIAGPAFLEKPAAWCDGGASGLYVQTLIEVAREAGKAVARPRG